MHIVIDISENIYNLIKIGGENRDFVYKSDLMQAIIDGTPIPEGHGNLIDADYLRNTILLHSFHANNKNIVPYSDRKGYRQRDREVNEGIINAPVIIEADKEKK